MFCNICRSNSDVNFNDMFNEYKNTFNKQNIYTINDFVENIRLLHDDVKKAGLFKLLDEIEVFQKIVTEKTKDLMRFHGEIR